MTRESFPTQQTFFIRFGRKTDIIHFKRANSSNKRLAFRNFLLDVLTSRVFAIATVITLGIINAVASYFQNNSGVEFYITSVVAAVSLQILHITINYHLYFIRSPHVMKFNDDCLSKPDECCLFTAICSQTNELAGLVVLLRHDENAAKFQTLHVLKKYRGHGLGRKLIRACEEQAVQWKCKEIFMTFSLYNYTAVRLYHQMGFIEAKEPVQPTFSYYNKVVYLYKFWKPLDKQFAD